MSESEHRIVVCLRMLGASGVTSSVEVSHLRQIAERAVAHGGRLVAWLPPVLVYDFGAESWEDALELFHPTREGGSAAVGVTEGHVEVIDQRGAHVALAAGRPVARACLLARLAKAGEVLVSREVLPLRMGHWVASGRRFAKHRGEVLVATRLDQDCPQAIPETESVGRLSPSAWVGVPPEQAVVVEMGQATVLHSPPGTGATRFFRELEGFRPHLKLGPGPAGEPLGALRRAFAREPEIAEHLKRVERFAAPYDRLIAGAGLRPSDASAVVEGWCEAVGGEPVVFVEEPENVDSDSLAAFMAVSERFSFVVRARDDSVPKAFEGVPVACELELESLSEEEAVVAIQSMAAGTLDPAVAVRYAKRGGYRPLGISEAICAALECGELAWKEGKLIARGRVAGRGRTRTSSHWIMQRLARLNDESRGFLDVLAVLGGEAEAAELAWLGERGFYTSQLGPLTRSLHAARWVRRSGDRLVSLSSGTLRRRLLDSMASTRRAELHLLAVELYGSLERPLLAGAAALHAALGGDQARALELGRKVGLLCRVNQLGETAAVFEGFGKTADINQLILRNLGGGWSAESVTDGPIHIERMPAPVPSATRVAARSRQYSADSLGKRVDFDSTRPRALPGEGRLAEVLERTEVGFEATGGECRKLLAAALWQARGSNDSDALLHSLEALAVARRTQDKRGERACVTLAVALSRRSGAERAAGAWEAQLKSAQKA